MLKPTDLFPQALAEEHRLDRRRLLRAAAGAAVLCAVGEYAGCALAAARARRLEVTLDPGASLAVGAARAAADAAGGEALVVRLDETTVVAFDRRCPHLGCPVIWAAERGRFECPCHNAAFEARTGRVLFGPPRRGLEPATVRAVRG